MFGGGSAWTLDAASGQYYLHNFLPEQPDLDWWNDDVRAEFDDILRFWFERGVAGFRIDVAHALVKDRELRDNPPSQPGDPPAGCASVSGRRTTWASRRRSTCTGAFARSRASSSPSVCCVGETYVLDLQKLLQYVVPDGLQLCMNLVFLHAPFEAGALAAVVAETESAFPAGATPVWHASSHDDPRFATRWCDGDEAAIRCALVGLLSLRGACILYQGDEIGLEAVPVPPQRERDMAGRDPCRTPMVWRDEDGAGFTEPGVEPWLPIGPRERNVADQRDDPDSILTLTRDLIALRKERPICCTARMPRSMRRRASGRSAATAAPSSRSISATAP